MRAVLAWLVPILGRGSAVRAARRHQAAFDQLDGTLREALKR